MSGPESSPQSAERPLRVTIAGSGESLADVLRSVDSALSSRPGAVGVRVELAVGDPIRERLIELCRPDERIAVADPASAPSAPEGIDLELPAGVELDRESVEAVDRELGVSGELIVALPRHPSRLSGVDPVARRVARRRIRARAGSAGSSRTIGVHRLARAGSGLTEEPATLALGSLASERGEHLRNRARSATNRSRFDAVSQVLARDRLRTRHERARAYLLEQRLAAVSPRAWAEWRARQARSAAASVPAAARSGTRVVRVQARRGRSFLRDRSRSRKLSG